MPIVCPVIVADPNVPSPFPNPSLRTKERAHLSEGQGARDQGECKTLSYLNLLIPLILYVFPLRTRVFGRQKPAAESQVIFFLLCVSEHQWPDCLGVSKGESVHSTRYLLNTSTILFFTDPNRVRMRKPSDLVIGGKGMIAEREDVIVRSSRVKGFSQVNRWKQERIQVPLGIAI